MKINKSNIWSVLEKYDSYEYKEFCDELANIILEKNNSYDFLTIWNHYDKIDKQDRDILEEEIGAQMSGALFSI